MTMLDEHDLIPLAPPRRGVESLFAYRAQPGPRANACDAPRPEEHQLFDDGPNPIHHAWIPPTGPRDYLDGLHALNLRSPEIGSPGDWHPHVWECRVCEPRWDGHYAGTSARREASPWHKRLREWLGTHELVDARPALERIGHPGAHRDTIVWCATHVRVVLERGLRRAGAHHAGGAVERSLAVAGPEDDGEVARTPTQREVGTAARARRRDRASAVRPTGSAASRGLETVASPPDAASPSRTGRTME